MTSFTIQHIGLEEANAMFNASVQRAISIVHELNAVLRTADQATQGQAVPLWGDLQNQWNGAAQDLNVRLQSGARASLDAHEWFKNGEMQTVRIMA